jgi:hypothetical protein
MTCSGGLRPSRWPVKPDSISHRHPWSSRGATNSERRKWLATALPMSDSKWSRTAYNEGREAGDIL